MVHVKAGGEYGDANPMPIKKSHRVTGNLDGILSGFLMRRRRICALPYFRRARRILDVGCGVCLWADELRPSQQYLGIDIEVDIISHNLETFGVEGLVVDLAHGNLSSVPYNFDLILALAVLEHFPDPTQVLCDLATRLSDDGLIVLTTPAPWADVILDTGARIRLFAQDKHQHYDLLSRRKLYDHAHNAGLSIRKFKRFLAWQNQFVVLSRV